MRYALPIVALALTTPAALAQYKLPVGPEAVYCGDGLQLHDGGVGSEDSRCTPVSAPTGGGAVLLLCEYVDGPIGFQPPWLSPAFVVPDEETDTVVYYDEDTLVTMERCD
ncbi:MAG: hypothetical protein GY788_03020 [bacterium]|nr:hypothetical protein [bacterium]